MHVGSKTRVEIFLGVPSKSVEVFAASQVNATRYYDALGEAVLECTVAPIKTVASAEQAAIRARVLANIDASKASRLSSNFEQHVRREVAYNFYRVEAGWSPSRLASHMDGIDFTKPLSVVDLRAGSRMVQYALPGRRTGNYFAEAGTAASELGINPAGRIPVLMQSPFGARALKSVAREIDDKWTIPGTVFHASGGGTQYFVPRSSLFTVGY